MKSADARLTAERPRPAVPTTLSDLPTIRTRVDPDCTLPMEPVMLAELCAQTQVSARRRALPQGLEYTVQVQGTSELPPPPAPVLPAVEDVVASRAARQSLRRTQRRQTLLLILGPCLGMSLGMSLAWKLDLGRPTATKQTAPARIRPSALQALPPTAVAAMMPSAPKPELPRMPAPPTVPSGAWLTTPAAELPTSAAAALPSTAPAWDPLIIAARAPARDRGATAAHALPPSGRKSSPLRAGSARLLPEPTVMSAPDAELDAPAAPAELPTAAPPRSETTTLPARTPAAAATERPAAALDADRTPRLLTGTHPKLPPLVRQLYRHESVIGTYRVCVQPSGVVASVTALAGIPFDDDIRRTLQSWRFAPRRTPACIDHELHFEVDE